MPLPSEQCRCDVVVAAPRARAAAIWFLPCGRRLQLLLLLCSGLLQAPVLVLLLVQACETVGGGGHRPACCTQTAAVHFNCVQAANPCALLHHGAVSAAPVLHQSSER